jgi:hypothetical protein
MTRRACFYFKQDPFLQVTAKIELFLIQDI